MCGVDPKTGRGFVHVKSWKGNRLYTEVVITEGKAVIRCRECLRWTELVIKYESVDAQAVREEETLPV